MCFVWLYNVIKLLSTQWFNDLSELCLLLFDLVAVFCIFNFLLHSYVVFNLYILCAQGMTLRFCLILHPMCDDLTTVKTTPLGCFYGKKWMKIFTKTSGFFWTGLSRDHKYYIIQHYCNNSIHVNCNIFYSKWLIIFWV